ncbi:hypothetical protein E6C72_15590 [Azospirillum sp. TSH100]|nr:hypothetical protein E6C72_15590 [Azospirillum sp. TSH100]
MVLLLTAAAVVGKLGSWVVYLDERALAIQQPRLDDTIAKTAATIRLVAATPAALHDDVLEASGSAEFRFWWDRKELAAYVHQTEETLAARARLSAMVGTSFRGPGPDHAAYHAELLDNGETKQRMLQNVEELRLTAEAILSFAREEGGEEARAMDLVSLVESVCDDMADGGAAAVSVAPAGAEVRVVVDDRGPGIAPVDLERVFEPFVRLERSRNRSTGGVGLGLSIARSIARGHGGDIVLENRPDGGLRATLTLPAMHSVGDRPAGFGGAFGEVQPMTG